MMVKRASAVRHSSVPAPHSNPVLRSLILYLAPGPIPVPLQFGPEGPTEEPVTGNKKKTTRTSGDSFSRCVRSEWIGIAFNLGGPHETLREPQEWSQWHQGTQVVCHHRLDRHLSEEGKCVCVQHPPPSEMVTSQLLPLLPCRWKLPSSPNSKDQATPATLTTTRRRRSASPLLRNVPRSLPSFRVKSERERKKEGN